MNPYSSFNKRKTLKHLIFDGTCYERDVNVAKKLYCYFFLKFVKTFQIPFISNISEDRRGGTPVSNFLFFHNISVGEVERNVNKKKNRSCDILSYSVKGLKFIINIIAPVQSLNKNRSLSKEIIPSRFKLANFAPKHNCNLKTDVNNYRLIPVLRLLSKIFERAVHNQVYKFIE